MRATISFEADVNRVNDIMRSLVLEESNALQDALIALEKATADRIVEGISEALEHINGVASQLEQYRQMMVSFERARFETRLPQPVGTEDIDLKVRSARDAVDSLKQFEGFLDNINPLADDNSERQSLDDEPEEG